MAASDAAIATAARTWQQLIDQLRTQQQQVGDSQLSATAMLDTQKAVEVALRDLAALCRQP
jgi:hypothetical protein